MLRLFHVLSRLAFTATLKGVHYSKVIPEWAYNISADKLGEKFLDQRLGSVIDKGRIQAQI